MRPNWEKLKKEQWNNQKENMQILSEKIQKVEEKDRKRWITNHFRRILILIVNSNISK